MHGTIARERGRRALGGGRMQYEHRRDTKTSNKFRGWVVRLRTVSTKRNGLYLSCKETAMCKGGGGVRWRFGRYIFVTGQEPARRKAGRREKYSYCTPFASDHRIWGIQSPQIEMHPFSRWSPDLSPPSLGVGSVLWIQCYVCTSGLVHVRKEGSQVCD